LREKVAAGHLGMKTGEGFRKWSAAEAQAVRAELSRFLVARAKGRLNRVKEDAADPLPRVRHADL